MTGKFTATDQYSSAATRGQDQLEYEANDYYVTAAATFRGELPRSPSREGVRHIEAGGHANGYISCNSTEGWYSL